MKKAIPSIVFIGFILISAVSSPLVLGKGVELSKTALLKADERYDYDAVLNHANETDGKYSNYEMLWKPFKQKYNKKGIVSATPTPPHLVNIQNIDYGSNETYIHIGTPIKFSYQQIMSGSSEHYWRSPFSFNSDNFKIRMKVYRVKSKETANISVDKNNPSDANPNPLSNPIKVFDTGVINATNDRTVNYIKDTVTLPENVSENRVQYNFTYLKGNFPIYPNEDYYTVFSYKAETSPDLYISRGDVGGNQFYKTHFISADRDSVTKETYNADFEVSTLFTAGMSGKMGGIDGNGDFLTPETEGSSIKWNEKFDGSDMSSGDYMTFNIPFRYTEGGNMNISVGVKVLNEDETIEGFTWLKETHNQYALFDMSYSTLDSVVGDNESVSNITELEFNLKVVDGNPDNVNFWIYDYNNNFTKKYEYSDMRVETANGDIQPYGFQVYHSLQITNGGWELTNPIEYYEFEQIDTKEDNSINFVSVVEHTLLTQHGLGFVSSYIYKNHGDTPPHEVLWSWAKKSTQMIIDRGMEIAGNIGNILQNFGLKLWEVVKQTVDAIQFYGAGLLNLLVMGFSIASYILYTVIIFKVILGLVVLVTKGSDAMLSYYSSMMDNIIGLSQSAVSLLPVV